MKEEYLKVEEAFFQEVKNALGDHLLLYSIAGSFGLNDPIPNWSDIDILIVLDRYILKYFNILDQALKNNLSNIHIGLTFYSLSEFNKGQYFKDPKTCHYLNSIIIGEYKPRILNSKVVLEINSELLKKMDFVDFSKHLHQFKRGLLDKKNYNEKAVFKALIVLIKIMLRYKNIAFCGYKNILEQAQKNLNGFNFIFSLPEDIINHPELSLKRYKEYVKFLNWLKDFKAIG